MKVCEVCIYFQDPIGLCQDHSTNVEIRHPAGEKGFVLDPGDDIMQRPGSVEEDGADGQPPTVDGCVEEYEEAVPKTKYQLRQRQQNKVTSSRREERAHLDQDELVQQHRSPHICKRDTGHNDQRANHEPLTPCFEDEAIWIGRLGDLGTFVSF